MTTAVQNTQNTLQRLKRDPIVMAHAAAGMLERLTTVVKHDVAIIFGSGWDVVAPSLGEVTTDLAATDLPGFLPPGVDGHAGRIQSINMGGKRILTFLGRKHLYETDDLGNPLPVEATVHAVRAAAVAGCKTIILTNAVGGLNDAMPTGTAVLIRDHNSLFVRSSLRGPQFLQCDRVYSERLRELCREVGVEAPEGVYAQVVGPHFESPAEAEFLRRMGVDIVGMSICTEALAARHLNMEVIGVSIVTDSAGVPTTHDDVLAVVRKTAVELTTKLAEVIRRC